MSDNRIFLPRTLWLLLGGFALGLMPFAVLAEVLLNLPSPGSDLVGQVRHVKAQQGDTLIDIASRYKIGQDEMVMANPTPSRYYWVPGEGTKVLLPERYILPDAPRVGIVVNIPEMRLYYYPPGINKEAPTQVYTYPISIGRMDWNSPLGATKIVEKIKDPTWTPPESIKKEHAQDGEILPDVVPAGPDNPLGRFAMRLGVKGSYLIHGTGQDKSEGIGMMVTHGCMRMFPEDVEKLFPKVSVGTQVNLVNQPIKLGWSGDTLYIEVSQPLEENHTSASQMASMANSLIQKKLADHPGVSVNSEALKKALEKPNGLPTAISGAAAGAAVTTQAANPPPPQTSPTTATAAKPPTGQVPVPVSPTTTSTAPQQPLSAAIPGGTVTSGSPATATNQANPLAGTVRQQSPAINGVPAGPPVTPASSKPEQQLLPPIY